MTRQLAWLVIYLQFPLWIAVGILGFAFGQWDTVRILVGGNVVVLLISYFVQLAKRRAE